MQVIKLASCLLALIPASAGVLQDGITAFREGRYSIALPVLQSALKESPSGQAKLYLALTQAAMGDCSSALPALNDNLQDRLGALAASRCYSAAGDSARAVAILSDLAKRFPNDADVLYLSAKTEMKAFNDVTFAMFQRTPASYRVHQLSAEILEVQNRYPDAVAEYRKAIEVDRKAPDLHYRLGRALLLQGHSPQALAEASEAFRTELAISPEDSASEFQLGQIAQVQGNTEQAQAHFERALKLSPSFANAAIASGKLYAQRKQYDRAIALLKLATTLQPDNESAHYALMTAYRNAGQMENAKTEKLVLDRLQRPPEGEFSDFLKKLGEKPPEQ